MIVLQNATDGDRTVEIKENVVSSSVDLKGKTVTVKPYSTVRVIVEKEQ